MEYVRLRAFGRSYIRNHRSDDPVRAELNIRRGPPHAFDRIDANDDGFIDGTEFTRELPVMEFRTGNGGDIMFCSKCGQEQASESVRFCSRCGFKLNTTEEALATRLIKMAMYLVLTMCAIMGWGSITAGPSYMQTRVIITLIAAITFYLLFRRDLKHIFYQLISDNIGEIKQVRPAGQETALPPGQSNPVTVSGSRRVITAEMAQPPSVTEQTTVLLDKSRR